MAYGDRRRDYNDMKAEFHRRQNNEMVEPSRVLFLRNLPNEVTEQEVAMIGAPFGRIRYLVLTKQRNQAFIEMEDFDGARRMSNYYLEHSPALRGANVQVQFSTRSSLKVEFDDPVVDLALHNANGVHDQVARELAAGKRILFVQVENQSYPITLDVLHKIFCKCGIVEKIVLFHKDGKFSAFVQMSDTVEACVARVVLNGQNIYDGCCTLRIEFSKNRTLEVKMNTEKQRDYTRDDLPSDPPSSGSVMGPSSAAGLASSSNSSSNPISAMMSAFSSGHNSNSAPNPSCHSISPANYVVMSNLTPQQVAFAALMAAAASGGNMNMEALMAAAAAAQAGFNSGADSRERGRERSGDRYDHDRSHRHSRQRSREWRSRSRSRSRSHSRSRFRAASPPRGDPRVLPRSQQLQTDVVREASNTGEPGPCILVTNLDDQQITCEDLFNLFGSYGDVQRLKLLYKKKNTAIMQFSDTQQAQTAMNMLHGQRLYGRRMRIVFSKHETINSPDEERNPEQALLLRDYSTSAFHRFKKPGSKNYHNIFAPSATLHLSNILSESKDDRIRHLFADKGFHVRNFRWLGNDQKQAVITLDSVDEGIMAVAKLHNFEQADRTHLKVSFSKQVDRPDFDR